MSPRLSGRDVSLDAPRSVDDGREVGALLSEEGPSPEELVAGVEEEDTRRARLADGLKVLDPRERAIIKARHLCARPVTLGALGRRMGISRERVRQIELRAVAKLRTFCGVGRLRNPVSVPADEPFLDEESGLPFGAASRAACGVLQFPVCPAAR
jgi:DNA-directed RNA polymerase sigma subunit (sigma70/sigma32)